MAISDASAAILTSCNRREPVDPSWIADWSVTQTGDATGGLATFTVTVPVNEAFVAVFMSLNDEGLATEANFEILTGVTVGAGLSMTASVSSVAVGSNSDFFFQPAKTMFVPDVGQQATFFSAIANPGVGSDVVFNGRAFLWPRNQVIGLPSSTFWKYLV